ncbi:MAG: BlaI/MecI/CopY family transcriptional regulator [Planctomycetota bacterium]|nr:BlaI/MecI/CopY family transcriptional regulator [Planctomycetota bacterium]
MSKSNSGSVTGLQLDVLRALWAAGTASASQVHETLSERRQLAPTTVATLLKRLEKRGLVTHEREGRQHMFRALVTEESVVTQTLDQVTDEVFSGDVAAFAAKLLTRKDVKADDLAKIRGLLEARERELDS